MGDAGTPPHDEAHREVRSAATLADKWSTGGGHELPPTSPTVPTRAAAVAPDSRDAVTVPAAAAAAGHGGTAAAGVSTQPSLLHPPVPDAASWSQLPSPRPSIQVVGGTSLLGHSHSQPPLPVLSTLGAAASTEPRVRTTNSSPVGHASAGEAALAEVAAEPLFPLGLDGRAPLGALALTTTPGAIADATRAWVHGTPGAVPRPPSGATVSRSEDGGLRTPPPPLPGEEPAGVAFTPLAGAGQYRTPPPTVVAGADAGGGMPTPLLGPVRFTTPPPSITKTPTQLTTPPMGLCTPPLPPSIGLVGPPPWHGSGSGGLTLPPSPRTPWPALRPCATPPAADAPSTVATAWAAATAANRWQYQDVASGAAAAASPMDTTLAVDAGLMTGVVHAPPPPPPRPAAPGNWSPTPSWFSTDVRRDNGGDATNSLWSDDALAEGLNVETRIRGPSGLAAGHAASSTDRAGASTARLWSPTVEGHTTTSWGMPSDGRVPASFAAPFAPLFPAPATTCPGNLAGGTDPAVAPAATTAVAALGPAATAEAAAAAAAAAAKDDTDDELVPAVSANPRALPNPPPWSAVFSPWGGDPVAASRMPPPEPSSAAAWPAPPAAADARRGEASASGVHMPLWGADAASNDANASLTSLVPQVFAEFAAAGGALAAPTGSAPPPAMGPMVDTASSAVPPLPPMPPPSAMDGPALWSDLMDGSLPVEGSFDFLLPPGSMTERLPSIFADTDPPARPASVPPPPLTLPSSRLPPAIGGTTPTATVTPLRGATSLGGGGGTPTTLHHGQPPARRALPPHRGSEHLRNRNRITVAQCRARKKGLLAELTDKLRARPDGAARLARVQGEAKAALFAGRQEWNRMPVEVSGTGGGGSSSGWEDVDRSIQHTEPAAAAAAARRPQGVYLAGLQRHCRRLAKNLNVRRGAHESRPGVCTVTAVKRIIKNASNRRGDHARRKAQDIEIKALKRELAAGPPIEAGRQGEGGAGGPPGRQDEGEADTGDGGEGGGGDGPERLGDGSGNTTDGDGEGTEGSI